ncbi:hypothetical protein H4CHR_02993 [Variovorax sp. PBS-H4]|uniref:hypothetical protein n=1 Tax=Variovorax sp. PBS-H4 TaxID=434008 RepID=UPI00131877CB|nr:hypothetical protein [Variovorax sp. PBS-H4]VTU32348.1 hypothetical protein H4CHR_02993 [Variovorax sp. PBS-H4]
MSDPVELSSPTGELVLDFDRPEQPIDLYSPVGAGVLTVEFPKAQPLALGLQQIFKGDKGEKGDGATNDSFYQHAQAVPEAVWTVTHNLGKFPSVAVVDSAGSHVEGDIEYLDINTVRLSFAGGFSGIAYLN